MNYLKKCFYVFCLAEFIFCSVLSAQNRTNDSLITIARSSKQDTSKVNALNALALIFVNNNPDTSVYFAFQAQILSDKLAFAHGSAEAKLYSGMALTNLGKYTEALRFLNGSQTEFARQKNFYFEAKVHTNLGNLFTEQGKYPQALSSNLAALRIRESLPVIDKKGIAGNYTNIGVIYRL